MPFPGLNIDNVPFFAAIAASGPGLRPSSSTTRVYDNRAIYLTDLNRLGAHAQTPRTRTASWSTAPTRWRSAENHVPARPSAPPSSSSWP